MAFRAVKSMQRSPVLWVLASMTACTAPTPRTGVAELMDRPAERALVVGLRAYEDAHYADAEAALNDALQLRLVSARDRANAHKTLAFIYCTSQRIAECEAAFKAARAADPAFALSKAEVGHPIWGPVYRQALP